MHYFNIFLVVLLSLLACMAIWHGWKFEIGKQDSGEYLSIYQLPLKRFFQKNGD